MPDLIADAATSRFTIFAVRKESPVPLLQMNVSWEQLMTDIVTPFDSGESFFIDGAPVKATDIDRLKILLKSQNFGPVFADLNRRLRVGDVKSIEVHAKQYPVLVEAILRQHCTDITAQVINAYKTAAKPKLSDHLPDKKTVFDAAIKLLIEATKSWGGSSHS